MGVDPRVWCWEGGEAAVVNDGDGSDCDDRGDDGDGDNGDYCREGNAVESH